MSLAERLTKGELSRWLVALILIPPVLLAVFMANNLVILGVVGVLGAICWWEFALNLLGKERVGLLLLAVMGWLAAAAGALFYGPAGQGLGLFLGLAFGAFYFIRVLPPTEDRAVVNLISRYALGHLYLSFPLSFVFLIKQEYFGNRWLFFTILITALADTGAFYVGSRLKGPKLCVKVSPNKTISGLIGGCLAALIAGALSFSYLPPEFSKTSVIILSLFLGVWGAAGDLFESALKRAMGLKDTSSLLLGHGGLWDRLDSILFNLPAVYFFVSFQMAP
ncbi:MAG: phosphatidate cytidylyltransferase [Deltaproteobacteria bacterium]|nr:phosphatidate cytidylyltransferase [Deltaproteobacteria bacterium]